jgi:DNA polymerase III epsilon subunit-like protein
MNEKYIILDTETTNDIECPLVYDLGFAVIDASGRVYASYSYVVADVFCDSELMASAYFSEKIPSYWEDIHNNIRILKSFRSIERIFRRVCKEWNIKGFIAHNMRFDYLALNNTKRYLTTSRYRFFFPYGAKFIDTLKLSRLAFDDNSEYRAFCVENDYVTSRNQNRYTAEIIYRFLTSCNDFVEEHTGLADCMIEKEIFSFCMNHMNKEDGYLW